jgi:hypothetical protein
VFPEWQPEPPFWVPATDVPRHWPRVCVIDPHPRKPIAVLWLACSPDNTWHAYRELFDSNFRTVSQVADAMHRAEGWQYAGERRHWSTDKLVPIWRRRPDTEPVVMYIIDTSANEHEKTSGETVAEQFQQYGISCVDAYKRNKDAGINAIHEALKLRYEWSQPGLVVHQSCPTVRDNFMNYVYERWGSSRLQGTKGEKQTVVKANDDFIDCIRYVYQMRLTHSMLRTMAMSLAREEEKHEPGRIDMGSGPIRWGGSREFQESERNRSFSRTTNSKKRENSIRSGALTPGTWTRKNIRSS